MNEDNKRPNAALINREWLEAAGGVLDRQTLAQAVLCACEYVLYGEIRQNVGGSLGVVMAMIKPALDSDISKYLERCERNQRNARSQSQRVAASGTQSQRVEANTTTTTTPTTTTTTISLRETGESISEEKERWLVFGYFWSTGSRAVKEELQAFWSYYESLGWKNNKGAQIVSKMAAARMWRRQFETGNVPNGSDAWFKALQACTIPDYNAWTCYAGAEREDTGAVVRLRCTAQFLDSMRTAVPSLERTLQACWRVPQVRFETI